MKTETTKKKKSKSGTVMAILKAPGEGKPELSQVVKDQIAARQAKGKPARSRKFMAALRKLAKEYDYSISYSNRDNGLEYQIVAVYTGKITVMLPEMAKLGL